MIADSGLQSFLLRRSPLYRQECATSPCIASLLCCPVAWSIGNTTSWTPQKASSQMGCYSLLHVLDTHYNNCTIMTSNVLRNRITSNWPLVWCFQSICLPHCTECLWCHCAIVAANVHSDPSWWAFASIVDAFARKCFSPSVLVLSMGLISPLCHPWTAWLTRKGSIQSSYKV